MGFNAVYSCLKDLFPQVDARLLRAVAIENPNDADVAAEIVLTEIIPYTSRCLSPGSSPKSPGAPTNVKVQGKERREDRDLLGDLLGSSSAPHPIPVKIVKTADFSSEPDLNVAMDESILSNGSNPNDDTKNILNETREPTMFFNAEDSNFSVEISNSVAQETTNPFRQEGNGNFDLGQVHMDVDGKSLICALQEMEDKLNCPGANNNCDRIANHLNEEWSEFFRPSADVNDATVFDKNPFSKKCETSLIEAESSETRAEDHPAISISGNSEDGRSNLDFCNSESSVVEDEKNALGQSSQVCRIDLLEEIINEAKTNKKTLFSSMESLINLMREVELQEEAAVQANAEAARGVSDIMVRVEEYKKMLTHAKEANDMHAGEVNGEKAILATEMRELQSRLLSLSDERDKSLAILDDMRQILEARLSAAEEMRKAAELEKLEKEQSARKALAEQEAMMEKVVQESVRLKQEAEENSKLQEFLMDRGRVVDMLQGEISVICEDVRLLKEKFDANLPLSKSFTSSQTSCILASSGSSHKTVASGAGSENGDSCEALKNSMAASVTSLSSEGEQSEERSKADHKALLDDGWDIFEKDAELNF